MISSQDQIEILQELQQDVNIFNRHVILSNNVNNFSMFITFIKSETKIAFPSSRIDKIYKWVDICSASSTAYDSIALYHCQMLLGQITNFTLLNLFSQKIFLRIIKYISHNLGSCII